MIARTVSSTVGWSVLACAAGSAPAAVACGKTSSMIRRVGPTAGIWSIASRASRVGVFPRTPPSTANWEWSTFGSHQDAMFASGEPVPTPTYDGSNATGNDADDRAASASWWGETAVGGAEVVAALPGEAEDALVDVLGELLAERVRGGLRPALQQGRGDPQVDRALVGVLRFVAGGQPAHRVLQPGQEELVTLQQGHRLALEGCAQQQVHPPLLGPQLTQVAEIRAWVDLGQRERGTVDAARGRPADHVRAGRGADELEQMVVRAGPPGQVVQFQDHAAHPHRQAHAAVEHDGEPDLFLGEIKIGHGVLPTPARR